MTMTALPPDAETAVRAALRGVADPEMAESIVDLGLVERVEVGEHVVDIVLIPTSATCPMADLLLEDTAEAARRVLPAGCEVRVRLDHDVPWGPQRMSPSLRARFGWDG